MMAKFNEASAQAAQQRFLAQLSALKTVKEAIKWASELIKNAPNLTYQAPQLEASILFEFAAHKNKTWQMAYAENTLTSINNEYLSSYALALAQRVKGVPIAFITGYQEFWSLNLKVAPCTLIPRQDTEALVEHVLQLSLKSSARVLDLGTGTGAIALALKTERPLWQITATDFAKDAVRLAKTNARQHKLDIEIIESDWFSALDNSKYVEQSNRHNSNAKEAGFDLIVSNPPYVEANSAYLEQGDLRFEPLSALVANDKGLGDIKHIIKTARAYLNTNAYLVVEHGFNQSDTVQSIFCEHGYCDVESVKDLNDIPRITLGRWCD